jgi:hypothetical protein
MSYVIPVEELSIAKMEGFRRAAKDAAIKRALDLRLVTNKNELSFREAMPATDFALTYTNELYLSGAVVVNTWTLVGDLAAVSQLANNKVAVFYKITCEDAPNPVTAVRFRLGATGATTLGSFMIQQFVNVKMTPEVYLSEPVVYSPSQWINIQMYCNPAVPAAGYRLGFGCFIAEPVGEVVS